MEKTMTRSEKADRLVTKLVEHAKAEAEKAGLTGMDVYPFALGYMTSRMVSILGRSDKECTEMESFLCWVR